MVRMMKVFSSPFTIHYHQIMKSKSDLLLAARVMAFLRCEWRFGQWRVVCGVVASVGRPGGAVPNEVLENRPRSLHAERLFNSVGPVAVPRYSSLTVCFPVPVLLLRPACVASRSSRH